VDQVVSSSAYTSLVIFLNEVSGGRVEVLEYYCARGRRRFVSRTVAVWVIRPAAHQGKRAIFLAMRVTPQAGPPAEDVYDHFAAHR
jgi:hypothetical protein